MAVDINSCIFTGRLTRDPELRSTPSGTKCLTFGLCVNDRRRSKAGEWEDKPNFIDCTMWGPRVEAIANWLRKGSKICIQCRIDWRQWELDGHKHSKVEFIVDDIVFMDAPAKPSANAGAVQTSDAYADEDIPF